MTSFAPAWRKILTLKKAWFPILGLILVAVAALTPRSVSSQRSRPLPQDIDTVLRDYDRLNLSPNDLLKTAQQTHRVKLATSRGTFDLEVEPFDIRADNYRAVAVGADGRTKELPRTPSRSFRGKVSGKSNTYVRLVLDGEVLEGIIITPDETFFIEPERNFSTTAGETKFIFYSAANVKEQNLGECGATLAHRVGAQSGTTPFEMQHATQAPPTENAFSPKAEAEVATEADYEFYQANGSNEAATNDDIVHVLTLVDGIYDAQLGIKLKVVSQRTWATASDPYTLTNASDALDEFRTKYDSSFQNGPPARDLTHLFTGKDLDGGTIGIAFISAICDVPEFAYGISQSGFSTNMVRRTGLTAHEMGHNFGASHPDQESNVTPTCNAADSIMNSTIQNTSNFCQYSRDQITDHVVGSGGSCLARLIDPPGCTYAISPATQAFPAAGGTGSVNVTAGPGCNWAASEGTGWLAVTSGATGSGSGSVTFSAAANAGGPRTGTVDVGGQKLTATQGGSASCGNTAISTGQTLNGTLATSDCRSGQTGRPNAYIDLYTFTGMAGQRVRIEMSALTALDTYLYLFSPSGTLVAENDDIVLGTDTNSRIPAPPAPANGFFILPQTGTYTIEATSYDNDATGSYSLTLTSAPLLLTEQGNNNVVAALDSVTFLSGQPSFRIFGDHNFSADQITRIILFTSDLGLNQQNPSLSDLSVRAGGAELVVENVRPFLFPGLSGSQVVVALKRRDGQPMLTGNLVLTVTCRSLASNTTTVTISP